MMGGMLAGHDQSGGEVIEKNGRKVSLTVADCSVADPGCLSRIPDLTFFHPGSRIRIKEFKYFNPKKTKKNGF
jgi:hypothetical protein